MLQNNLQTICRGFSALIAVSILFALSSCKKTEACGGAVTSPLPVVMQPVQFQNCSENANAYFWTFEGLAGGQSTEESPSYTFSQIGDYIIELEATRNRQIDKISFNLHVGYWNFDSLIFSGIPGTKPNGDPWDQDSTGPDLAVRFEPSFGEPVPTTWDISYNVINDVPFGQRSATALPDLDYHATHPSDYWIAAVFDFDPPNLMDTLLWEIVDINQLPDHQPLVFSNQNVTVEIPRTYR